MSVYTIHSKWAKWFSIWCVWVHIPEQTCVSVRPQQQTERPHSHQSDSACSGPPPRPKGPVWTCPAPDGKDDKVHLKHYSKHTCVITSLHQSGVISQLHWKKNCIFWISSNKLTFLTVLSGSRAMSGILASTMREKRFRIKLEYLKMRRGFTSVVKFVW